MNEEKDIATADPVDRLLRDKKSPSAGKGIAILALLVALAAVSESAWRWWEESRSGAGDLSLQQSVQQLRDSQQQLTQAVSSVRGRVDELANQVKTEESALQAEKLAELDKTISRLSGQAEENKAAMSSIQGSIRSDELRISAVEAGLINVAATARSSVELELAEIGFLLRVASERLQLFADPDAADLALQAADNQIEALQNPMFLSVRQRIASARQALSEVPRIDYLEISTTITDMQAEIANLPFKGMAAPASQAETPEEGGWWASVKNTLSSLVTVRRRVPQDVSLLSLEDKDYLRQGLWLQLESAQLALMRQNDDAYQRALQRFGDTLNKFFENGASPVQNLLQELASLQLLEVSPVMPDISAPWTQLQQLRDSRRLLNPPPAVKAEPSQPRVDSDPAVEDSKANEDSKASDDSKGNEDSKASDEAGIE